MESLTSRTAVTVARHPLWLDALGQLLTRVGVKVEGHTTSPAAGLALVEEMEPDLLVVEVEASDGDVDGWQCLRRARERHPNVKIIAVADSADERSVDAAFASGAAAFCSKAADPEDFAAAVRQSFDHSIYLAASRALPSTGTAVSDDPTSSAPPAHDLTRARARDPPARRGGLLELAARADAVGDRADGQVPPLEHLSQARRREPDGGEPLGAGPRAPAGDSERKPQRCLASAAARAAFLRRGLRRRGGGPSRRRRRARDAVALGEEGRLAGCGGRSRGRAPRRP